MIRTKEIKIKQRIINLWLTVFIIIPFELYSQSIDSIQIIKIDSLIQNARTLNDKREIEKALENISLAETIAVQAFGKNSSHFAKSRYNHGRILYFNGDYLNSEKYLLEAMSIQDKVIGKENSDYAWTINNLGNVYHALNNYRKAESKYIECKNIREKIYGKDHLEYAMSLNNLGLIYKDLYQFNKAEHFFLESKPIFEKLKGKMHPFYANSLHNLALLYKEMGHYNKAETFYLEALSIREEQLGINSLEYSLSLNSLGILYLKLGDYVKSEKHYLTSKIIVEKLIGKENKYYTTCLINLAILYNSLNKFQKAEALSLEALDLTEKMFGNQSEVYATVLHTLANIYIASGYYNKAEKIILNAKQVFETNYGKEHKGYVSSLSSLSNLYYKLRIYSNVEELNLEILGIQEKNVGKEHPTYADAINNLATLYHELGNYKLTEKLYKEVLELRFNLFGEQHPDYALSLENLASLYLSVDSFDRAEEMLNQARSIQKELLGRDHSKYAHNSKNLGILYIKKREFKKAEFYLSEAKSINERSLGKRHPDYIMCLDNLIQLYEIQNQFSISDKLLKEKLELEGSNLLESICFLSEKELRIYSEHFQRSGELINKYLSCRSESDRSYLAGMAFNHALFHKGFLQSAATKLSTILNQNPESEKIGIQLKSIRSALLTEYLKNNTKKEIIGELENRRDSLEKELVRNISNYSEYIRQIKWEEVQSNLLENECAIEFVQFEDQCNQNSDIQYYAAILIRKNDAQPQFVKLLTQNQLDNLLQSTDLRKLEYVNQLYSLSQRGASVVGKSKTTLFDVIWKPLEEQLNGIHKIYYSGTGLLHRINLNAIPINDLETLADRFKLVEMTSTRQLVITANEKSNDNNAILYGGLHFEYDSITSPKEELLAIRSNSILSFNSLDSTLRGGSWEYLIGTEREVKSINKILNASGIPTEIMTGSNGTEESFKRIGSNEPSPRIVHIATHGYFFPDVTKERQNLFADTDPVFKISDHPMLRSGLIMAGGNSGWKGEKILEGQEDGVLTAYEISQMNLSNTELVVLSACETGLGDIKGNEGVYGLQRAFKIAGAKYLIMSLWQVPDKQTSLLMTTFYKKWLEEKLTIPDAFHAAQKELRDIGLDPYQWAGFVLVE